MFWSQRGRKLRTLRKELHHPVTSLRSCEEGSVEAGLTIIPTTLFFLLVLQIVLAGSWQVMERSRLHDLILRSEVSGREVVTGRTEGGQLSVQRKEVAGVGQITNYTLNSKVPIFEGFTRDGYGEILVRNSVIRVE